MECFTADGGQTSALTLRTQRFNKKSCFVEQELTFSVLWIELVWIFAYFGVRLDPLSDIFDN